MAQQQKVGKVPKLQRAARNAQSGKYKVQRERTERNRVAKLTRYMRRFPNYKLPEHWEISSLTGKLMRRR